MTAHWSLGVLIGVPVLALLVLGILAAAVVFFVAATRDDYDPGILWVGGACSLAIAVIVVGVALSPAGYWPYRAEYHQWRPVTGTVTQVSSRIISDGNQSVNQRFVVRFAEHDSFYGCDDTRCATVKVGDHLALSCKREWQYASVSGYGCRWLS